MSKHNYCSPDDCEKQACVNVNVNVDVPKIVKYSCMTGVLIVGIIFGTNLYKKMLENGFLDIFHKQEK
jgi:hypothetical protein